MGDRPGGEDRRWWRAAFAIVALASCVVILRAGRGWTFNVDDWGMILYRRSGGIDAFLAPHNGNFEPALTGMYRLLFATVGLEHFTVYRCVEVAFHLALSALLFAYLRTRLPAVVALLATLPVLFMAYGYSVLVWSYDAVWVIPLACLVLVFLVRDRGPRRSGLYTMLLLLAAVLTSGAVAAVLVTVAVDTALNRSKWREWWSVAVPGLLLAAWGLLLRPHIETPLSLRSVPGALDLGDTQRDVLAFGMHHSGLAHLPDALLKTSNAAAGGLFGVHTTSYWPLLVIAAAMAILGWLRKSVPARAIALLAGLATLWVLVGLFRRPDEYGSHRYVYTGVVFLVLILAELGAARAIPRGVLIVVAAAALAITAADVHRLRQSGRDAVVLFHAERTELRRLQCAPGLPPDTPAKSRLLPLVTVGPLRLAVKDLGSPVGSC